MSKHPMQPVVMVGEVARFKENKIVRYLLDFATSKGTGLNQLLLMPFDKDDWTQFHQLTGWSVSGAGDLPEFDRKVLARADADVEKLIKRRK